MPRQPRLHVPGGFYHVTLRGNHRDAIFRVSTDYERLERIVAEVLERFDSRLHAFCWMPNHLHMLLQIAVEPLGRLMQPIASRYAQTYQARLATTGHLFERRYHSLLVDTDSYLLELIRYIHLNPVRAGLADDAAVFPWSSHRIYLGRRSEPWVTTDFALKLFHADEQRARAAYAAFVAARVPDSTQLIPAAINSAEPRILGDDRFLEAVTAMPSKRRARLSLHELVERCCRHYAISPDRLRSASRYRDLSRARAVVAYLASAHGIASLQAVAQLFSRDESTMRRGVERLLLSDEEKQALGDVIT